MKLKNKKTGEIGITGNIIITPVNESMCCEACSIISFNSLKEINAEWEDYIDNHDII